MTAETRETNESNGTEVAGTPHSADGDATGGVTGGEAASVNRQAAILVKKYVQVQDGTSSPDQILIQVLEGAVRLVNEAKERIDEGNLEAKNDSLIKAQLILRELSHSLDKEIGEQTFRDLCGLYFFATRKLVEGNLRNDKALLDEALEVLESLLETWRAAVATYRRTLGEKSQAAASSETETRKEGLCVQC